MDLEKVESLLKLMREYRVAEYEQEEDGSRLRLALQPEGGVVQSVVAPVAVAASAPQAAPAAPAAMAGEVIKSPMVGTFYTASKPGAPPFVSVGDVISKGQVLCIVEAMKLMNQIEAEVTGTLVEILVENESPVQFGQPLFRIEPS